MAATPLRCVTFDLANTLARLASSNHVLYRKPIVDALTHFRLPVPSDNVLKAAFRSALGRVSKQLPHYGGPADVCERTWWRELVIQMLEEAGCEEALRGGTFSLVFQRAYTSYGSIDAWAAVPDGAREALAHAKSRGLVVGVVCNSYHRYVDNNLPLLGLHHNVDFTVVSNEVGYSKPSPHIYAMARARASDASKLLFRAEGELMEPSAMLHVGSNLAEDFLGAKQAGMRALLLDESGETTHPQLVSSEVLRSLRELPARIDEALSKTG